MQHTPKGITEEANKKQIAATKPDAMGTDVDKGDQNEVVTAGFKDTKDAMDVSANAVAMDGGEETTVEKAASANAEKATLMNDSLTTTRTDQTDNEPSQASLSASLKSSVLAPTEVMSTEDMEDISDDAASTTEQEETAMDVDERDA